jgi:hypothetical protein
MIIVKVILLIGLIRLLIATKQPFVCSGLYAGVVLFFHLISGGGLLNSLFLAPVVFGLASLYFWLLARFESSFLLFWLIVIVGLIIGLV